MIKKAAKYIVQVLSKTTALGGFSFSAVNPRDSHYQYTQRVSGYHKLLLVSYIKHHNLQKTTIMCQSFSVEFNSFRKFFLFVCIFSIC